VPPDLSTSIDKLRKSASRLNRITDQASETVKEVEAFLNKECSAGVQAFVKIKEIGEEEDSAAYWLEYRRVGQKYRIAVTKTYPMGPPDEDVKPWSDCARDVKLEAITKLPDLIQEIAKKLDEQIVAAEAGVNAAVAVLVALTSKEGA
jgi:hypothetical protein